MVSEKKWKGMACRVLCDSNLVAGFTGVGLSPFPQVVYMAGAAVRLCGGGFAPPTQEVGCVIGVG